MATDVQIGAAARTPGPPVGGGITDREAQITDPWHLTAAWYTAATRTIHTLAHGPEDAALILAALGLDEEAGYGDGEVT